MGKELVPSSSGGVRSEAQSPAQVSVQEDLFMQKLHIALTSLTCGEIVQLSDLMAQSTHWWFVDVVNSKKTLVCIRRLLTV